MPFSDRPGLAHGEELGDSFGGQGVLHRLVHVGRLHREGHARGRQEFPTAG